MSSTSTLGKGEWICSEDDCGNRNFSKRDKCNKCGKIRRDVSKAASEIGKSVAEKSKGLFSADDWMCKSCGNINWARRNTCNVCNTNKVNIQGQRTGFGGGFNEREEIVLYKERNDEDDEYDEFGMKKKKFRGQKEIASSYQDESNKIEVVNNDIRQETNIKDEVKEYEDDEEESEGEDGDLSKYDLWGDDVNATKPIANNIEENKVSSDSSSSSGSSSESSDSSDSESSSSSIKKEKSESRKRTKSSPRSRFANHTTMVAVYN